MNEEKRISVLFGPEPYGEAGTSSCVCFTTLCFLFWANGMGWLGDGATIAMAAFQLGIFVIYAFGGISHIKRGESLFGNVYCVFAAFFGGAAGALNLTGALAGICGFSYSWQVEGWVFLVVGVIVLAMVPVLLTYPISLFGIFLTAGVACVMYGFIYAGILPAAADIFNSVATWAMFICGLLGLYTALSTLYAYVGVKMDFLSRPIVSCVRQMENGKKMSHCQHPK